MRTAFVFVTSAMLATVLGLGSASANLITNGDFSTPGVGTGWSIFANGGVSGWTSNDNQTEIDYQLVVMPSFYLGTPGQSMELNGNQPDTISQTISGLTPGKTYLLTWGYGDRPGGGGAYQADVYFGGNLVTIDTGTDSGLWSSNAFDVTATASSEVLSFEGVEAGSNPTFGNEIADVSLTGVPEPLTLSFFGAGLAGAVAMRRRKKKAS